MSYRGARRGKKVTVTTIRNRFLLSILVGFGASGLSAQTDMRGHWSGKLDEPGGSTVLQVDLDKTASGWVGSIGFPAFGASGLPLEGIMFADGKISFHFPGGLEAPAFTGTLSADGKALEGEFAAGLQSLPLKLTRTGEANVELPRPSAAVAPEFIGSWEGTVDSSGPLPFVLTISNGKDGAEAVMVSLDSRIPATAITQKGTKLTLYMKAAGGLYEGEMNKDGTEISGTLTQLGMSTPLVLKKAAAAN